MFAMSAHYSNPVTYSPEVMAAAAAGWERIYNAARLNHQMMTNAPVGEDANGFLEKIAALKSDFAEAMDDDFNAPRAVAFLQEFTREVNQLLNSGVTIGQHTHDAIHQVYRVIGGDVLGLVPENLVASSRDSAREAGLIQLLVDLRKEARKAKNFAESDRLRDELLKLGVVLEDRPDGTMWRVN